MTPVNPSEPIRRPVDSAITSRIRRRRTVAYRVAVALVACLVTVLASTITIGGIFSPVGAPAADLVDNLTSNPSFERDSSGWVTWQSALTRVKLDNAPDGNYVGVISRTSGDSYSIDDAAPTVAVTGAGDRYQASAYLAAASTVTIGKSVSLVLRESTPDGVAVAWSESAPVVLATSFRRVDVVAGVSAAGNCLELYLIQKLDGAQGDSIYLDAVTLSKSRESTPVLAPSPSATVPATAPGAALENPVPHGPTGSWVLRFQDEFAGSSLDGAKWNTGWFGTGITKGVNEAEVACYNPANVAVSGGALQLTLRRQEETCAGVAQPYSAAMVNTNGKYAYTYGYAEARLFIPATPAGEMANWPVFWTNGANWPQDGENDIAEGLRGGMDYRYHSAGADGQHQDQGVTVAGNWTGWHTFGSEWSAGLTRYFYDGILVGEVTAGTDSPNYLILAYTQGEWPGPTLLPATAQVDYVRVWQR